MWILTHNKTLHVIATKINSSKKKCKFEKFSLKFSLDSRQLTLTHSSTTVICSLHHPSLHCTLNSETSIHRNSTHFDSKSHYHLFHCIFAQANFIFHFIITLGRDAQLTQSNLIFVSAKRKEFLVLSGKKHDNDTKLNQQRLASSICKTVLQLFATFKFDDTRHLMEKW